MSPPLFDQLEELLRQSGNGLPCTAQFLQSLGVPSATIAILDNGHISSHCISSIGDDPSTLFQACSVSKPAAVMAALRLVEEGIFAINDRIRPLLPAEIVDILTDPRTEAALNNVTVAQLMSHTAGLSVSGFPGYPYGTDVPDVATLLNGKGNTTKINFCSLPGSDFIYSGGGISKSIRCP
jgi:CubicO group peptidase (beta-lactamase class C family)